jgi:magnesium transporter
MPEWIDLIDPTADELRAELPTEIQPTALHRLLAGVEARHPRPTLQSHGDYVFGVFLVAIPVPKEDRVFYQEIDVVLTHEVLLTVSKTPPGEKPYDPRPVQESCTPDDDTGMMLYRLVDDIAEHYLDLVEALDDEIDELEDAVESLPAGETRTRLSALRHDLLGIGKTLAPTRDAVRRVVDNAVELRGRREVFPHDVEIAFNSAYDKLLRAVDGLALSRDLLAGVRDYLTAKIANDQNEVTKKLTAIASILLLPTFIVGLYGQNFLHHFPEIHWRYGYLWSWGLIIGTTIVQVVYFRRKKWI